MLMKNLVFSSIRKRKVQSLTMVLVIAASVALLLALSLMYLGASQGVQLSKERGGAEVMLVPASAAANVSDADLLFTGSPTHMYLDSDIVDKAAKIEGVDQAAGQFFSQTISASCCSTGTETRVVGIDPERDWVISPLADYDVSKGLGDNGVLLGSRFDDYDDPTISILGKEYEVKGHLAATGSDIDQCILVDINTARTMSEEVPGYDHYWQEYGSPSGLVSDVLVDLDDSMSEERRTNVIRRLGNLEGVRAIERSSVIDDSQKSLSAVFVIMLIAGVLMLVVCVLQLFSRFYTMAWDRKAELALYRAVGATERQLRSLVCMEAAIVTGVGAVIGIVLGVVFFLAAIGWMQSGSAFPFVDPMPTTIVLCAVVVVVLLAIVAFLSILTPLRQMKKIDPSLAMQQSDID